MGLPTHTGAATAAITRAGVSCSITEPVDTDAAIDGYGKTTDETWVEVAVEPVVRVYQPGNHPEQDRNGGGRYRTDSPVLVFIRASAVQEGFRVAYEGALYEVDALTFYPTHIEATTTTVH